MRALSFLYICEYLAEFRDDVDSAASQAADRFQGLVHGHYGVHRWAAGFSFYFTLRMMLLLYFVYRIAVTTTVA